MANANAATAGEKKKISKTLMLGKRILGAFLVSVVGFSLIFSGGWIFTIGIALIISAAVYEFIRMFSNGNFQPNKFSPIIAAFLFVLSCALPDPRISPLIFVLSVLSICAVRVFQFKNIHSSAALDLIIELSTLMIITLPGSYLVRVRFLPEGVFWIIASIMPACIADIGAYLIGSLFGKKKLSPLLSPKKTIAGYFGGVFFAVLSGAGMSLVSKQINSDIPFIAPLILALTVGILSPLGDLTKSIFKRHFKIADTGNLIPGHGGILDRIDTWLWAAPISYYFIVFFFL